MTRLLLALLLISSMALAKNAKILRVKNSKIEKVNISYSGAVLSFPTKPTKVIMGKKNTFSIEYINNDLAISPLRSDSRTHLFVYVENRRFSLDLIASPTGHAVVQVRDADDNQFEVQYVK